jgi:hypothetical protein
MSKIKMPGFTAEASLFKASEYYHKIGMGIPGESMIQPASLSCDRLCHGDPDCEDCCECIRRGGKPRQCCW